MTITDQQFAEITDILFDCGVSPFNVDVLAGGIVVFYSNGLRTDEIDCARYMLVKYLASL